MEKNNQTRVTVRLDAEASTNLQALINQTGATQSKIINDLLKRKDLFKVIDGRGIASELHKLRLILKNGQLKNEQEKEISEICSLLVEAVYKLFEKDGV